MIRSFRGIQPQIHPSAFIADSAQVIGDVHIGEGRRRSGSTRSCVATCSTSASASARTSRTIASFTHAPALTRRFSKTKVTVGHSVTLHGCYVEHGALIGIGSIVLDDARVGAHSLVAAGSLLSPGTIIPPRSLVMGVPAKVKRPLSEEEVAGLNAYWQNYVEYTKQYKDEG